MLQTKNNDGEKPELNGCSSPNKPRKMMSAYRAAAIARLVNPNSSHAALRKGYDEAMLTDGDEEGMGMKDPDSSHAALRKGYDEAMLLTDGTDIVGIGMKESISQTLDKHDCNSNGVLGSKQVVASAISHDADYCLASTVCENNRECHDDNNHFTRDEEQHIVEKKIQDCDANGGSVSEKTEEVFVARSSSRLMGMIKDTNPCSTVVDTPCIVDKRIVVDMHYVAEDDGESATAEGKKESLHLAGDADDNVAMISSQSHGRMFSAEKLDAGDQERSECLDGAVLVESSDRRLLPQEEAHVVESSNRRLLPKEEEAHDQTDLGRRVDDDLHGYKQTAASGEGLRQSAHVEAALLPGGNVAGMVRGEEEDCQLAVEATSDPYYFSDGDEQTGDAESKPVITKRECLHVVEVEGDKTGSPSDDDDHARVFMDPDPGGRLGTDASEICVGTFPTERAAGLQNVDVAAAEDTVVTGFEVSWQEVAKEEAAIVLAAADEGDDRLVVQNPPEVLQVYFRRRRRSRSQDHTLGAATESTAIKYYTRRSPPTALESLADAATMTEPGRSQNSGRSPTASMRSGGKGTTPFVLPRNRMTAPAKAASKDESADDDYMKSTVRKSRGIALQQQQNNNRKAQESSITKMLRKTLVVSSTTAPSTELPDWLPRGWTTEVKIREGGYTAGTKDKYYYEPVSGRRFRSKIEVMRYLQEEEPPSRGAFKRWQGEKPPKSNSYKKPSEQKTTPKEKPRSAPSKPPNQKTQEHLLSSHHHMPARMKTTPVTSKPSLPSLPPASVVDPPPSSRPASDVIPPPVPRAPESSPNGPIWLPWGGTIAQRQGAQGPRDPLADSSTGDMTSAPISSASDQAIAPDSKDQEQKETENRGKFIFRLKRKDPQQEPRTGKSKRPTYEVVGRENAASSAPMQIQEEKQKVTRELGGRENPVTSSSTPPSQEEMNPSSMMKEPAVSGSYHHAQLSSVPLPVSAPFLAVPNCQMAVTFCFSDSATVPPLPSDYNRTASAGSLETEPVGAAAAPSDQLPPPAARRTTVQKPLTKVATMKQLEGLGRLICKQGLKSVVATEQQQPIVFSQQCFFS